MNLLDTQTGEVDLLGAVAPKPESIDDVFTPEAKAAAERERIIAEARAALFINDDEPLSIRTHEECDEKLLLRLHHFAALQRAQSAVLAHQKSLDAWDKLYAPLCEAFMIANPPPKGKTLTLTYGSLSLRTVPESIALDTTEDPDQKKLQEALAALPTEKQAKYKVTAVPTVVYSRDLNAIKKDILEQHELALLEWRAKKPEKRGNKPFPKLLPGLKYTPKRENFSIKHEGA